MKENQFKTIFVENPSVFSFPLYPGQRTAFTFFKKSVNFSNLVQEISPGYKVGNSVTKCLLFKNSFLFFKTQFQGVYLRERT